MISRPSSVSRDLRAHGAEIRGDGGEAVGFLHAQFAGIGDDRLALRERGGDGEDGNFVDDIGDFRAADLGAAQARALDLDDADRLGLLVLDDLADVRAHADEDGEDAGARLVEADVFDEQMRARLGGGGDEPEGGAGDVAGHLEVARLRRLAAVDRDGEVALSAGGRGSTRACARCGRGSASAR